ncbi:plant-specific domain TIGR01589 family protein [Musa troglodytarum]|uniref:Plant-specific domain TIGR01589 family protein n=1 Tax=Musa troglodytarum TaxID=320322 RepID=A0A9E7F6Q5_9LILI|nr:plant-specific domain TIGR01589 family protein [Musa troglodytarum]
MYSKICDPQLKVARSNFGYDERTRRDEEKGDRKLEQGFFQLQNDNGNISMNGDPVAAVEKATWFARSPSSPLHQWPLVSHVIPGPRPRMPASPHSTYRPPLSPSHSTTLKLAVIVQHLIEQCLVFQMSKDECMEALAKHADIKPVITSTGIPSSTPKNTSHSFVSWSVRYMVSSCVAVWKELEKENKEFFQAYVKDQAEKAMEMEAVRRIQQMLAESAAKDSEKED